MKTHALLGLALAALPVAAQASPVIPYTGAYDESVDGPGDYDTLGGPTDLGLFYLVEGSNSFSGNVNSPVDAADAWLIGISAGYQLVSASIAWATNLPGLTFDFLSTPPAGFLQQNTWGANAPSWTLEESTTTPTIFLKDQLEATAVGSTFDVAPASYDAPSFAPRGAGIYSNLLDATGTCAQTYVANFPGFSAECTDAGLDYTITYVVEKLPNTPTVPLPAGAVLLISALGAAGVMRRKSR